MNIRELRQEDATALDRFVQRESEISLLQSWHWGEFQKKLGRRTVRLGVFDRDELVAATLLVQHELPLGFTYLYAPRGPVVRGQRDGSLEMAALTKLIDETKRVAREWGAVFIRIDPPVDPAQAAAYKKIGFTQAASQIQPRVSARLDLTQGRDKILANMKGKWRYNIRLATKKGVAVRVSIAPTDTDLFIKLLKTTTARDAFVGHEDSYYKTQIELLGRAGLLKMYIAEFEGKPLAAIIVGVHGDTAIYLHGASSDAERNRMPTFAVQWEAIKAAERLGLHWYDFHGVAPTDEESHPWAGITRFKLGFGAERRTYLGALDLPLKKVAYRLYSTRLKLRRSDGR